EDAINNSESNPVIDQSTFTSNSAYSGAAIRNSHSSPSIDRCVFENNFTTFGGDGGAVANVDASKPTVTSSAFKSNRAGGNGGAISVGAGCDLVLRNSLLAANSADLRGGAIFHVGGTLTIDNCTVADNSASYPAGGIYNEGTTRARNTTLWGNRVLATLSVGAPEEIQVLKALGTLDFAQCVVQNLDSL